MAINLVKVRVSRDEDPPVGESWPDDYINLGMMTATEIRDQLVEEAATSVVTLERFLRKYGDT
jgi:hypothetical protein